MATLPVQQPGYRALNRPYGLRLMPRSQIVTNNTESIPPFGGHSRLGMDCADR